MNFIRFGFLFIAFFLFSCSDDLEESFCYHFDQRQCQTDEFGPDIAAADSSEWAGVIETYLESKGVEVIDVNIKFDHYDAVCEACDVCPETHRFYVKVTTGSITLIQGLNLFNIGTADCNEFF